jgi:hypothetical protein
MKVRPEREAPIMPNATRNHGDCLFPVKKVVVSAPFDVITEMRINIEKYTAKIVITRIGDMRFGFNGAKNQ